MAAAPALVAYAALVAEPASVAYAVLVAVDELPLALPVTFPVRLAVTVPVTVAAPGYFTSLVVAIYYYYTRTIFLLDLIRF